VRGGVLTLPQEESDRITAYFAPPEFAERSTRQNRRGLPVDHRSGLWPLAGQQSQFPHRQSGYASVTISLKPVGGAPGDATDAQMDVVADLAERYSFDELRVTHEQNLVLPHVAVHRSACGYDALVANGWPRATTARSPI
jgi:sulfite reductase (NADPH) hemoprotein beta-component